MKQLLKDLERDEGWRDYVYDDATGAPIRKGNRVKGYATVGYGFCLDIDRGAPMPESVGEFWLRQIVEQKWCRLVAAEPWILVQPTPIQRALGNMAYQMGVRGLQGFHEMMGALKRGDRSRAKHEALDSLWARKHPERAGRIADLIGGDV